MVAEIMLTQEEIKALGPLPTEDNKVSLAEVIARLIESDPHSWSSRPCQTCNSISAWLGRPFGCQRKKRE